MLNKDYIITTASVRLIDELTDAESLDDFNEILQRLGYTDLYAPEDYFMDTLPYGKILLMGALSMKEKDMKGCFKTCGISESRIEYVEYDDVTNYDISHLDNSIEYRLILIGPVPHKAKGMGDESSVIVSLENNPNVTKVRKLYSGNQLKITKQSLKDALTEEIEIGYLQAG